MRFQVPQFIETETKVVGPFTLKQFLFLAAGTVIVFILQFFLNTAFLIIAGLPIGVLAFAMAFYKIDGVSLPTYILMALSFISGTKRYQFKSDDGENNMPSQH